MDTDLGLFLRGIVLGFSIAAPVGPIGILCIRRTLASGPRSGFVSGLGAATADAVYGGVAAFGLTAISSLLIGQQQWLRLIGGLFLCVIGIQAVRAQPGAEPSAVGTRGGRLAGDYLSTLGLTLTNPTTILSFVAIFAGVGWVTEGQDQRDFGSAAWLVAGVFSGSTAWWLILSTGVSLVRGRFNTRALRWTNRLAGGIIALFGALALISVWA